MQQNRTTSYKTKISIEKKRYCGWVVYYLHYLNEVCIIICYSDDFNSKQNCIFRNPTYENKIKLSCRLSSSKKIKKNNSNDL